MISSKSTKELITGLLSKKLLISIEMMANWKPFKKRRWVP